MNFIEGVHLLLLVLFGFLLGYQLLLVVLAFRAPVRHEFPGKEPETVCHRGAGP